MKCKIQTEHLKERVLDLMKLKSKLIVALLSVIFIPIILISATTGLILNYQINSIQESYDVNSGTIQLISNPTLIMNRVTRGVYNEIKVCALKTPHKFEDMKYIKELNKTLRDKYSFIILRKDNEIIYTGDTYDMENIKAILPGFGEYNSDIEGGVYSGGENPYLVKQQDFFYSDESEGSIFIVTDVNTLVPQFKTSLIQFLVAFIIIICFTAAVFTYWIYRSVLRPLRTLRVATNKMKEGDLNFSISTDMKDEVGMLCLDFEDMRIKLKELIDTKMQYEEDSKELISNISHDLKTPLTAIKGYAEGILDGVADNPEKMDKYLKTIYTKANDMTALVDELSLYSKIDCNSIPYHFVSININQYFVDCISELTLDLEVKNIEINYINEVLSSIKVMADPEQLKRVVNNIIGNCVKYIGRHKGLISIYIRDKEEYIEVGIEDNGKGIAKEDLPFIFNRFYRTDTSRNSSKGGSGLGLAIAKKIIDNHGGIIRAESLQEQGTTIYFTLKKEKNHE